MAELTVITEARNMKDIKQLELYVIKPKSAIVEGNKKLMLRLRNLQLKCFKKIGLETKKSVEQKEGSEK